jgi:serine/threonine protein kinase
VYRVQHVRLDKILALKVLFEHAHQNPRMIKRFEREARATCRIGHENIVEITDFARDRSIGYYFVMELLEGETLGERLQKLGPMPAARVVHIAKQMADALAATHTKGIIHRDLKPENIFLTRKPGRDDFVKLVDFGIAAMADFDEHEPRLTNHGTMLGTPSYMSPEQARGKRADHRSDIYSFGIILYELVTGKVPFRNNEPMVVLEMHRSTPPIPPTVFRSDLAIPAELESIIMRALRKSTTQRYQSMREIFNDFDALGSTLDMTTLETVGRRVDNEGHRAAELHEREEPEWLDEELLLVEPKPAKPIIRSPQLLSEVDTTMPMAIDPETSKQSTTVPMNRPRVSDELPTSSPLGPDKKGVKGERLSAPVATVLPKASTSKPAGVSTKSPWERAAKSAHLEPVPQLPPVAPQAQSIRAEEKTPQSTRFWHYPAVMVLLGFLVTFAAYVVITDGFSSSTDNVTPRPEELLTGVPEKPSVETRPVQTEAEKVNRPASIGTEERRAAEKISSDGAPVGDVHTTAQPTSQPPATTLRPPLIRRIEAAADAKPRRRTENVVSTIRLELRSKPLGASVSIDSKPVGTTPITVSLPRGKVGRIITFEKGGVIRRKTITTDKDHVLTVRLTKSARNRGDSGGGNYDLY